MNKTTIQVSDRVTDQMISIVNQNHKDACYRSAIAGRDRKLSAAHHRAMRSARNTRVMIRQGKTTAALLLCIGAHAVVRAMKSGMIQMELGSIVATVGVIGSVWLAASLWQEFKMERNAAQ